MAITRLNRRMFLTTSAGGVLSIPFLGSLLRAEEVCVDAATASNKPRCLVVLRTGHGGIAPNAFYPDVSLLNQQFDVYGRQGRWAQTPYTLSQRGGSEYASISQVVSAESSRLTPALADKLSFLMGLDYSPQYVGHNIASHLGGYAQRLSAQERTDEFRPTVDQLIAHSSATYATDPSLRAVIAGRGASRSSWYHARPLDRSSPIVAQNGYDSPASLWLALFQPGGSQAIDSERGWVVDHASRSYSELMNGSGLRARRLSSTDRQRLEMHMEGLYAIQDRIQRAQGCGDRPEYTDNLSTSGVPREEWLLWADLVKTAVSCGLSKVFTMSTHPGSRYSASGSNHHEEVPHRSSTSEDSMDYNSGAVNTARQRHFDWYQQTFEHSVLPIIEALNDTEVDGYNMLDESLVVWVSECGVVTHSSVGIPLMTAGGLGGQIQGGRFIDYRDLSTGPSENANLPRDAREFAKTGLPYDQFLGNLLQGFEVPLCEYDVYRLRESFHRPGDELKGPALYGGYGGYVAEGIQSDVYRPDFLHDEQARQGADNPLPMYFTPA
jgi:hypothetical protein